MSFNYNNFLLYSNSHKKAIESNSISRNTKPFTEESSFGYKVLYIKRDIPKLITGHSVSVSPDLVGKNIETFQSFDNNNNNTSNNDKTFRPKSIFYQNKSSLIPKIKLSKRNPSHKYNVNISRDVRVVDRAVLERLCTETYPGFESRSLRHDVNTAVFIFYCRNQQVLQHL